MPKKNCPANKPRLKKKLSTGQRQVQKVVSSFRKTESISVKVDVQIVDVQVRTYTAK